MAKVLFVVDLMPVLACVFFPYLAMCVCMMNVWMHLYVIVEFWLMVSAVCSVRISLYKTETKTHIHTQKDTHTDTRTLILLALDKTRAIHTFSLEGPINASQTTHYIHRSVL